MDKFKCCWGRWIVVMDCGSWVLSLIRIRFQIKIIVLLLVLAFWNSVVRFGSLDFQQKMTNSRFMLSSKILEFWFIYPRTMDALFFLQFIAFYFKCENLFWWVRIFISFICHTSRLRIIYLVEYKSLTANDFTFWMNDNNNKNVQR